MPKLTKRIVDAAEAQTAEYFVWDNDIPGFGLRVLPSGRKGYVVQYRAGRRSRRISLGPSTVLTCEQARTRAITIVAAARNGQDPAADRDAGRKAITIKELAERFDKEHIAIRVKASTGKEYRRNLQRFILPALGQLTVTGITRADVAKFHHDLRHIPYQANRCLEVISKMFSLSEMWGLRPDGTNPRKHIRKYPEEKRERFLSAAELRRIGEVLREMEAEGVELPSAILAARLLILTGCRLNEIMSLQWSYVDLDVPALRLPDSKTGAKVVHVGQPVVDLLRGAQRIDGNPRWSLPNSKLPAGDAGKLPLPDRAAMDEFVDQTKTLVGALGWDLFREMRGRLTEPTMKTDVRTKQPSSDLRFFFRGEGFAAEMALDASGDFIVLMGSKARVRETSSIPRATKSLRRTLLDSGVLKPEGDFLIFTSDYSFSSASAAAAAVIGASANGKILWKLLDGRTYADWEAGQGNSPETGTDHTGLDGATLCE